MRTNKNTGALRSSLLVSLALIATASLPALAESKPDGPNKRLLDPKTEQPGLKIGEHAPTLTLKDATGKTVNLAAVYKEHAPVVVTFYRGGWCPFCSKSLMNWGDRMDDLKSAGGTFVAISPETPQHALETAAKSKGDWVTLVDADGAAMRAFKLGFELDPSTKTKYQGYGIDLEKWNVNGKWELPAPATYIIDANGVVQWVFSDWNYKKRANPDDVIAAVRKLTDSDD